MVSPVDVIFDTVPTLVACIKSAVVHITGATRGRLPFGLHALKHFLRAQHGICICTPTTSALPLVPTIVGIAIAVLHFDLTAKLTILALILCPPLCINTVADHANGCLHQKQD